MREMWREREGEGEGAIPDCYTALCSWTGWGRRETKGEEMRKGRRYRMEKRGKVFPSY